MIKAEAVKYKGKYKIDFVNELSEATLNPVLESFKENFEEIFKDFKCNNHPKKSKGTIVINANNPNSKMKFELKNFCCSDFKKEIQKSLKS